MKETGSEVRKTRGQKNRCPGVRETDRGLKNRVSGQKNIGPHEALT